AVRVARRGNARDRRADRVVADLGRECRRVLAPDLRGGRLVAGWRGRSQEVAKEVGDCHVRDPTMRRVRLLFIGDVVGSIGRRAFEELLPGLRERERPDFVIVNGENAAGGVGITAKIARALLTAGADAITLGNHAYRHADVYE